MSFGAVKAGKAFVEIALSGHDKITKEIGKIDKKIRNLAKIKIDKSIVSVGLKGKAAVSKGLANISARVTNLSAGFVRMGAAGIAALGAAGLAGGLYALTKSIGAASNMQETMNKFNVVFGESSGEVKKWSDNTANAFGRSKKQLADFLSSSQDLLVPMGLNADAALGMSKGLSTLAMDLASFNNVSDADAMNDLQAALTGSGEVMKKYGVIVSEATVKQQLLNNGIDPKNATEAQKAMARYNIILEGTSAAQGDVARSSGSYANQLKALQAHVDNLFVTIGGSVLPVLEVWLSDLQAFIQIAGNASTQTDNMGGSALAFAGDMTKAVTPVELFARAWYAVTGSFKVARLGVNAITSAIADLIEMIAKTGVAQQILGKDMANGAVQFAQTWKEDLQRANVQLAKQIDNEFELAFGDKLNKQLEAAKQKMKAQQEQFTEPLKKLAIGNDFAKKLEEPLKAAAEVSEKMLQLASPDSIEKTSTQAYTKFAENKHALQERAYNKLNESANITNATLRSIDKNLKNSPIAVGTIA